MRVLHVHLFIQLWFQSLQMKLFLLIVYFFYVVKSSFLIFFYIVASNEEIELGVSPSIQSNQNDKYRFNTGKLHVMIVHINLIQDITCDDCSYRFNTGKLLVMIDNYLSSYPWWIDSSTYYSKILAQNCFE